MSQLQKKITHIQRREGPRLGFGPVSHEQPRAMLLGVVVADGAAATAAAEGGADVAIIRAADGSDAAPKLKGVDAKKVTVGALVERLDEAGAAALREAGCDFVISTLEATESEAVDPEAMGQVLVASPEMDDTTVRALGPMNLDALYVERTPGPMTLAQQLALVRLASFSATPLLVTVGADSDVGELRVLRDSGVAMAVLPGGAGAETIAALVARLKEVPAPRKSRQGQEIPLVPTAALAQHDDDGDDD